MREEQLPTPLSLGGTAGYLIFSRGSPSARTAAQTISFPFGWPNRFLRRIDLQEKIFEKNSKLFYFSKKHVGCTGKLHRAFWDDSGVPKSPLHFFRNSFRPRRCSTCLESVRSKLNRGVTEHARDHCLAGKEGRRIDNRQSVDSLNQTIILNWYYT